MWTDLGQGAADPTMTDPPPPFLGHQDEGIPSFLKDEMLNHTIGPSRLIPQEIRTMPSGGFRCR